MSKKSFEEFVNEQTAMSKKGGVDWAKTLSEWREHLGEFYQFVEGFLAKYVADGKISVQRKKKSINEEFIGTYDVDALFVSIGGIVVRFDPIGTVLLGVKGRVDMIGPRGTVRFVLVDKDSSGPRDAIRIWTEGETPPARKPVNKWVWKIATPPPRVKYLDLEPEAFDRAMMEVVNG